MKEGPIKTKIPADGDYASAPADAIACSEETAHARRSRYDLLKALSVAQRGTGLRQKVVGMPGGSTRR